MEWWELQGKPIRGRVSEGKSERVELKKKLSRYDLSDFTMRGRGLDFFSFLILVI